MAFQSQPTNTGVGVSISPAITVVVQDAAGNMVTTAATPITLTLGANPGTATLGGTLTVNALNGVATFPDLTLDQAGAGYTLTAAAPGLTGVTSQPFAVVPAPTITSFTPTIGGYGSTVTITGTSFTGATAVAFGGVPACTFTVDSDAQITAVVGSGASGPITVTAYGNTATSTGAFTYVPAPVITSFTPSSGGTGTVVTISGAYFTGATAVTFGASAAASFTVIDDATITATPGSGDTGTITVTTPGGTASSSAVFIFYYPGAGPGDWWMFHHDPQHSGRSPFTGPALPVQRWTFPTGGAVDSSPAFGVDGTIYVGSEGSNLYAIYPDGTQKWEWTCPTGNSIGSSPALGTDGTVYVGADDGNLYAINPDGTQAWAFPTEGAIISSPALGADGTIYIGSEDSNLYAIYPDGTQKWVCPTGSWIDSSPAIGTDGTIYVGSSDSNLYAIDPADGTPQWAYLTGGAIGKSSPAIGEDGTIYVASFDGNLYAITPGGAQTWTSPIGWYTNSSPAIGADGTIYVGSSNGNLYAINPADGSQLWTRPTTWSPIMSSPAIGADGTIYIGLLNGNFDAIDPVDGSPLWTCSTGGSIYSSPALAADGTVYVGSDDGYLYAFAQDMPTQLQFGVQPGNTPVGVVITPAVTVLLEDAAGNLMPSASTPVTLALGANPGTANLGGTLTVTAVNGVATFSDLTLEQAGTGYTLNATAPGLTGAVSQAFTVIPAPTIASFTPSSGGSGTTVTITGTAFTGATTVAFGGIPAATFTVTSDSQIIATVGSGASGPITVTAPGGTANSTTTFTFVTSITAVTLSATPSSPVLVGTPVSLSAVVTGGIAPEYKFYALYPAGGMNQEILIQDYALNSTCTWTPALAANYTLVVLVREHDSAVAYAAFATVVGYPVNPIPVPTITSFTPSSGGTGTVVTITGTNFTGTSAVAFGGVVARAFTVLNATSLTATVGTGPGGAITVTTPYGTASSATPFAFAPPITTVTLSATPSSSVIIGTPVSLSAVVSGGLVPEYKFYALYPVGGVNQTVLIQDYALNSTCTWNPALTATYTLVVLVREHGSTVTYAAYATVSNYTVKPIPVPTITYFTPSSGGPGTVVTITGANFTGATAVTFGGIIAAAFTVTNATKITATVWNGASGTISVTTPYGTASSATTFSYVPPITAVTLNATPGSSVIVGTPVSLSAVATGGLVPEYKFYALYPAGGVNQMVLIQDYALTSTCTWTPVLSANFTLVVLVREHGSTAPYAADATLAGYLVKPVPVPPITAVSLNAAPNSPVTVGTPVSSSAVATGGNVPEYKFYALYPLGGVNQLVLIQDYALNSTCTWTPALAANYTLVVLAREHGSTVPDAAYNTIFGYLVKP